MQVWQTLKRILAEHDRAALVTVLDAKGSVPREAGARMIVLPSGDFHGTIGGGTLEWEALSLTRQRLSDQAGVGGFSTRRFALGPELGQCCGGQSTIAIEILTTDDRPAVDRLADREQDGRFSTIGRIGEDGLVCRDIAASVDKSIKTASLRRDGVLLEIFGDDRRPLWLFGAGHVGRALVLALAPLKFSVTWIDSRANIFPGHVPQTVTCRQVDDPAAMVAQAPADAFILVMTHSHALDQDVVQAALQADRFGYVGLIGSATKRRRFEKRMVAAGLPEGRLKDLVCPIGLDEIRSKEPAAIALGTAAQLVMMDERQRRESADAKPAKSVSMTV